MPLSRRLQQKSRDEAQPLLAPLAAAQRGQLVGSDAHATGPARPHRPGAAPRLHRRAARPGAGRHGLGGAAARRDLRTRIRLNSEFEAPGGRHRRPVSSRKFAPARERGWIAELDGERVARCSWCANPPPMAQLRMLILAPRRAAWAWAADRRMHRLRARQGLPQDGAVDQQLPDGRARHLRGARLPARQVEPYEGFGQQPQLGETWELRL